MQVCVIAQKLARPSTSSIPHRRFVNRAYGEDRADEARWMRSECSLPDCPEGRVEGTSAATQTKAWNEERLRQTRRLVADQANALRSACPAAARARSWHRFRGQIAAEATRSQGRVEVTSAATQTKAWHEEWLRQTRRVVADQANALRSAYASENDVASVRDPGRTNLAGKMKT